MRCNPLHCHPRGQLRGTAQGMCTQTDLSKLAIPQIMTSIVNSSGPKGCQSPSGRSCPGLAVAVKMNCLEWRPETACQRLPACAAAAAGKTPSVPSGAAQMGRQPRQVPPPTPPLVLAVANLGRRTTAPAAAAHQAAQPGRGWEKQALAAPGLTGTRRAPGTGTGNRSPE